MKATQIIVRSGDAATYLKFVIKAIGSYSVVYFLIWLYKGLVLSQKVLHFEIVKSVASLFRSWNLHEKFGQFILQLSGITLGWFGYKTELNGLVLKIVGLIGVRMHFACMGFEVMAAFLCLFFSYSDGMNIKSKWLYAFSILLLINILNIIRIDLMLLNDIYKVPLYFDHHDIFNFIIYILIVLSFYLWTLISDRNSLTKNRYSNLKY